MVNGRKQLPIVFRSTRLAHSPTKNETTKCSMKHTMAMHSMLLNVVVVADTYVHRLRMNATKRMTANARKGWLWVVCCQCKCDAVRGDDVYYSNIELFIDAFILSSFMGSYTHSPGNNKEQCKRECIVWLLRVWIVRPMMTAWRSNHLKLIAQIGLHIVKFAPPTQAIINCIFFFVLQTTLT